MVTGVSFRLNPLRYDMDFKLKRQRHIDLFGPLVERWPINSNSFQCLLIKEVLEGLFYGLFYEQLFRLYMAYLLNCTIFVDKHNQCHMHWMINLEDIAVVGNFDGLTIAFITDLKYVRLLTGGMGKSFLVVALGEGGLEGAQVGSKQLHG